MMCVCGYAKTDKGNRSVNEDNLCINRNFKRESDAQFAYGFKETHDCLIGVFDGISRDRCTEMAPFIAAKTMARFDGHLQEEHWELMLGEMNQRMNDYARHNGFGGFGTAMAAVSIQNGTVQACNLGNSRIYLYRDGILKKISEDHISPKNGSLTRYLGMQTNMLQPHIVTDIQLCPGEYLLLCSDGLTGVLSEEEIGKAMVAGDCKQITEDLLEKAVHTGGTESITIIVLTIEERKSWISSFFHK